MNYGADITKIALSRHEIRKLRWISKHEPVYEKTVDGNQIVQRLYRRGLIKQTYSEQYPYMEPPYGVIEIPHNAYCLSDEGLQYLNRTREQDSERRITSFCAIWGAITGTAAIIVEVWLHFL